MTSVKVRLLRGERVLSADARVVAFAISGAARRRATWGGAIGLRDVLPAELAAGLGGGLVVELHGGDGGRFPIVVHGLRDGVLAQFRGMGPRPRGIG